MTGFGGNSYVSHSNPLLPIWTKAMSLRPFPMGFEILEIVFSTQDSLIMKDYSIIVKNE